MESGGHSVRRVCSHHMPTRTRVCVKAQPSGRRSHQGAHGRCSHLERRQVRGLPETLMPGVQDFSWVG